MSKRPKKRASLAEILASCSDTLFPAELGAAPVSVDSRDVDGDTPLHVMLWRGDVHAVIALIDAGADVNAVGDMSETPLHIAVRNEDVAGIEALLHAGADPDRMSEFGETPKMMADQASAPVRRLFRSLVRSGRR